MIYKVAHILRERFPWMWNELEMVNGWLFAVRYHRSLKKVTNILSFYQTETRCIIPLSVCNIDMAERFFKKQPTDAFEYFKPHGFDKKSLLNLCRNKAFLAYLVMEGEEIVGYFFLRCSFTGKCFRGYMTDKEHRRMGINKLMGQCATEITEVLSIPMFGSISPNNVASMKSAQAVNEIKVLKTLDNGDFFVQYLKK